MSPNCRNDKKKQREEKARDLPDERRFLLDDSSGIIGGGFILLLRTEPDGAAESDGTVAAIRAISPTSCNAARHLKTAISLLRCPLAVSNRNVFLRGWVVSRNVTMSLRAASFGQ